MVGEAIGDQSVKDALAGLKAISEEDLSRVNAIIAQNIGLVKTLWLDPLLAALGQAEHATITIGPVTIPAITISLGKG
jgi:hypothetical protein